MAQLISCSGNMTGAILIRDDATLKLVAIIKKTTQEQDALWSACLLELAARCQDPAVAQVVVDEQVRIRPSSRH